MKKILPISLKLNLTQNTLGGYGLKKGMKTSHATVPDSLIRPTSYEGLCQSDGKLTQPMAGNL